MSLFLELGKIHNKMHTLIGRTGENAARIVIPIVITILHQYRKHVDSCSSDLDSLQLAVKDLREGGRGVLDATLTELRVEHSSMSETLTRTLDDIFRDVLGTGLPPARLNALLDYIASQESFLAELTDEDFLGAMFETLVSDAFRGDNGQFFTPKNIILIVREMTMLLLKKESKEKDLRSYTVCDPCCGSARFLIYWSECILKIMEKESSREKISQRRVEAQEKLRSWAEGHLYGIDIEPKIASYACLNMLLHGDGSTNVATADSLNNYGVFAHWPKLVAFAKEFVEKWDDLKEKYAASNEFERAFILIEGNKVIIEQIAKGNLTEIDLADSTWADFLRVIDELVHIEELVKTNWQTLANLQRASDFKSVHELMKYEWSKNNTNVRNGFDVLLTNPPFGRGGKNLQVSAENENERFILAQYDLATELWLWDASLAQLERVIQNRGLKIETKEKVGNKQKTRSKDLIAQDIKKSLNGREWLTIEDVFGKQGVGYTSKITLLDSDTDTKHTIYFDSKGQPILFKNKMPKQILFVEQFLRITRKGGKIYTVLDTGVLSNLEDEYVRRFIFKSAKLHSVTEFPHGAFKAAKANVKTAVVLMERKPGAESDYRIFSSLPEYLGYDIRKKDTPPIYENDLGRTICDYSYWLDDSRFCNNDCPWEHERYCTYGDLIKMARASDRTSSANMIGDEGEIEENDNDG